MRITTAQMYDNLMSGIQRQSQLQARGNAQVASGTRFQGPADAGLDYKVSLDIRHAQASVKGSLDAIAVADSRLGISQTMLQDMSNIMTRAESLAVQYSSAQIGAQDRASAAVEVGHLLDKLLADGNQRWQGQSIFAGTAVDSDAFSNAFSAGTAQFTAGANTSISVSQLSNANAVNDTYTITLNAAGTQIDAVTDGQGVNQLAAPVVLAAGSNSLNLSNGAVLDASFDGTPQLATAGGTLVVSGANVAGNYAYIGSDQNRVVAINDTQQVLSNIRGDTPGFTDALNALKDFQIALQNNDVPAIQNSISTLTSAGEQIVNVTTEVGARINSLSAYRSSYEDVKFTLDVRKNDHEGVDMAAVVSQLQQASIALQASYNQIAQLKSLSLVNFL